MTAMFYHVSNGQSHPLDADVVMAAVRALSARGLDDARIVQALPLIGIVGATRESVALMHEVLALPQDWQDELLPSSPRQTPPPEVSLYLYRGSVICEGHLWDRLVQYGYATGDVPDASVIRRDPDVSGRIHDPRDRFDCSDCDGPIHD